jgi:hypothetical protein
MISRRKLEEATPEETKQYLKKAEELFQEHWENKDWLNIWYDIEFCCSNLLKKQTKNHFRYDLQEIVEEATLTLWSRLKRKIEKDPNYKVKSLVNYCYLPTYFAIHNPKLEFREKTISLDQIVENGFLM